MCFCVDGRCCLGMASGPFSEGELLRGTEAKMTLGLAPEPKLSGSWEMREDDLVGGGLWNFCQRCGCLRLVPAPWNWVSAWGGGADVEDSLGFR